MMDTLSDVLRAVRLKGAVFFAVDASTPWVAETPAGAAIAPYIISCPCCWRFLRKELIVLDVSVGGRFNMRLSFMEEKGKVPVPSPHGA